MNNTYFVFEACDNGLIKIWKIPEQGLTQSLEEPLIELKGHTERLYCIKFHPYAKNVLASASYDRSIKLWNIDTGKAVLSLKGFTDVVCSNKISIRLEKRGFLIFYT